ncbi:hypothetical protein [Cyclobacterium jeungdonense]|uniref:Outer membrane protein beta-barrel domain-containing protein n=1 Tax=Cyclobacterium jeungdonense TaxID=708087 RepID=A0ABT8C5K2_9BACT|nr:hypothetical protein [Cyclobacterium jeungdonense]MDN3687647.1 hypothetical protein [Cyclobacterium jeungdonense]
MNPFPLSSILHIFLKVNRFFRLKLIFVLVFSFAISFRGTAQTETVRFTAKQAVYLEVGGNAGRYAFNYGRIFYQKGKLKLNASAGFSMFHHRLNAKTTWLPVVPLEISAFYGKSNHHLELGMGVTSYLTRSIGFNSETFQTIDKVVFDAAIPLRIGYRYQKPEGGFFFRVGYTPFLAMPIKPRKYWAFQPVFAGLSLGLSF